MSDSLLSLTSGLKADQPIRRRYSRAFKRQVVEASFQPGASAAQVARQHGLNDNLLHTWRWHYRSGLLGPVVGATSTLIPVTLAPPALVATSTPLSATCEPGVMTIRCGELHITLQGHLAPAMLQTLLASLRA